MRKAAELIDDRFVCDRITRPLLIAEARDQFDCKRLIFAILAVLERHIQKQPLLFIHAVVEALLDCDSGSLARDRIGRESTWRATEQVA